MNHHPGFALESSVLSAGFYSISFGSLSVRPNPRKNRRRMNNPSHIRPLWPLTLSSLSSLLESPRSWPSRASHTLECSCPAPPLVVHDMWPAASLSFLAASLRQEELTWMLSGSTISGRTLAFALVLLHPLHSRVGDRRLLFSPRRS